LAILLAASAINYLWLRALGVDYFGAYLELGFLVALLFGVVAVAIDLDSQPDLIAAHPMIYLAANLGLLGVVYGSVSAVLRPARPERELVEAGLPTMTYRYRSRILDLVFNLLFSLAFAVAMLAWGLLYAPLQYWVTLVCGAPARDALASSETLWVIRSRGAEGFAFGPKDPDDFQEPHLKALHARGEMTEVGFARKPVAFTAAITALVLFGISRFV
jgi:hypothetical protein